MLYAKIADEVEFELDDRSQQHAKPPENFVKLRTHLGASWSVGTVNRQPSE